MQPASRAAPAVHQRDEAGEAGVDERRRRPPRPARPRPGPSTSALMAIRWSMWVATIPPPGRRPAGAVHDQVVALDFHPHAVRRQQRRGGGEPVALLHPQLLQPAHARGARGAGGGDRQDRVFVDHARRALRRHVDRAQRAVAWPTRSPTGSPPSIRWFSVTVRSAPISRRRREQAGAQRIQPDAGDGQPRARHQQRRHQRERGRGRIARHHHVGGAAAPAGRAG